MAEEILSIREKRRYEQQTAISGIGESGQEKIKLSRVLVIGAGGKGTSALKNLITAGVGFIGISDDTLVQEDSLGRQSLFGDNDIGKQKAIVSKQYLQARNTFTDIKVHNIRLTEENLNKVIEDYHVIIDATNNYESHYAISKAAIEINRPVVFSAIKQNKGILTTLNYKNKKSLTEALPDESKIDVGGADTLSPVVIINSLTGSLAAAEVLKIILQKESVLCDNFLVIDASLYSLKLLPK
jgi:molybdopterin/thiamine biosynthesis adenylyltransferase